MWPGLWAKPDKSIAAGAGLEPRRATGLGEIANFQNVTLPLGHRDNPARVEKVEDVRGLDALVVGGQHHPFPIAVSAGLQQGPAFCFRVLEMLDQDASIRAFEIVA